ncbi:hypothetical protein [Novosphingobium album (ex Hu et al. 2023)]|uniref:Uncharacterized protein n=1 Tax=Novosphingobium album (ex Hu et al. 2023) TaxID=2930093 RepID=A0ABT0B7Y7_9SPHN|nr:hypothetical protein [Novosphingobium album (ex Hu et al. 2023)]MCJ2181088.1 hypothetical protein [Novosphingobium album (ex Hu et al. 2023)]
MGASHEHHYKPELRASPGHTCYLTADTNLLEQLVKTNPPVIHLAAGHCLHKADL